MYAGPADRVDDRDELFDLVEAAAFGHFVSLGPDGLEATGLPVLAERAHGAEGRLRAHFARANPHWRHVDGADVLVILPLADGYVSPSWYPSKRVDGRVVPTWNYEVVHVRGTASIHDDPEWLRELVVGLTARHEGARTDHDAWSVADAPQDFIDGMLRGIVGVEVEIADIEGKRKLSGNRSAEDRRGVIDGLGRSAAPGDQALHAAMLD